jgi:hypothetical protein
VADLGCGVVNHLLCGQVEFVADEQFVDVVAGVAVDFLQPLLDVVEGLLVGAVIYHDDAVCASVIT